VIADHGVLLRLAGGELDFQICLCGGSSALLNLFDGFEPLFR
jgi:hypothetical protein